MRNVRLVVLPLVVVALAMAAASSASAALPELGKCVKQQAERVGFRKVYHGAYTNSSCTKKAKSDNSKYEWVAGPGEKKEYESPGAGEPAALEVPGGNQIECANHKVYGEYTGAKTETRTIGLYECKELFSLEPCQSIDTNETPPTYIPGTIISQPLEGELGAINAKLKRPSVGWAFKPKTGPILFIIECGPIAGAKESGPTGLTGPTGASGITGPTGLAGPAGASETAGPASPSFAKGVRGGTRADTAAPSATTPPKVPTVTEYVIEGSVIGSIKPVDAAEEEFLMSFSELNGKQAPEMFEGGSKSTMTARVFGEGESVAIGMSAPEEEISNEEKLEIKAIS